MASTGKLQDVILRVQSDGIPADLRDRDQWVPWRLENRVGDKPTKVPYQLHNGRKASSDKPATWTSYKCAIGAYLAGGYSGIGFVFTADDPYCGIDLDHCRDAETVVIESWAQAIIDQCASYTEISPSGEGVKIFCRGKLPSHTGKRHNLDDERRIELYDRGRYFTVTGHVLPGVPAKIRDCQPAINALYQQYFVPDKENTGRRNGQPSHHQNGQSCNAVERCRNYIAKMPPAVSGCGGHNQTFNVACEIFRFGLCDSDAAALLAEYSQRCQPEWSESELRHKLSDAKERVAANNEFGCRLREQRTDRKISDFRNDRREDVEKSDSDGGGTIKKLANAICATDRFAQDAGRKLYRFAGGVYKPGGEEFVRRYVKKLLNEWKATEEWSRALAENVVEYIRVDAPQLWDCPPLDVLNVKNGLLDILTKKLRPHDAAHLSPVQLPVVYDPAATCQEIEKFVGDVFPADATALAWEIPAYLMLPNTSIQKALLLIGPGGNGKSTWLAMVREFLGKSNTSSLSLHKLESDRFSVARLYGKLANICPDLPSEHLTGTSVFKLITGGDQLTGEYKFKDSFDFNPFVRLVFSANDPPRSEDSSQGFFERWLVMPFERSFRGTNSEISREVLDARLSAPAELSGLLNKALAALPRIRSGKGFTQCDSVTRAGEEFQATTNPLAIWLDRFIVDNPGAFVAKKVLRIAFNAYLQSQGKPIPTETAFGLAFGKLRPRVDIKQRTINGKREWCYVGIERRCNGSESA